MSILYVTPGYFFARESLFIELSKKFDIHFLEVACRSVNGSPTLRFTTEVNYTHWYFPSAKFKRLNILDVLRLSIKLVLFIIRNKPLYVVASTQGPWHTKVLFALRKLFGYKIAIVTEKWDDHRYGSVLHNIYARWGDHIINKADKVFYQGERNLMYNLSKKVSPDNMYYYPMVSTYFNEVERRPNVSQNRLRYGYVGRLTKEKGADRLLCMIEMLNKSGLDFEFLIVGSGDWESRFHSLENVRCFGWLSADELSAVYKQMNVFVLLSHYDGFSTVVSEAMSFSLPLILSEEVGCRPDVLSDNGMTWEFFKSNVNEAHHIFLDRLKYNEMCSKSYRLITDIKNVLHNISAVEKFTGVQ